MNGYVTRAEKPERDFVSKLKALGFKPAPSPWRSTMVKGAVWVFYTHSHATVAGPDAWQPFDVILSLLTVAGAKGARNKAVKGELSDHSKALLRDGWRPTRWEHATGAVIELPIGGDVAERFTVAGVTQEITRDGRLRIRR